MTLIRYLRLAFGVASKRVARAIFAFAYFRNIPALGQTESSDGPRTRAIYGT